MKKTIQFQFLFILGVTCLSLLGGCGKTDDTSKSGNGNLGIKISSGGGGLGYPFEISPIKVYVNNEYKASIGNSTTTDCDGLEVDGLIKDLAPGSYSVAFVLPGNVYVDGSATIAAGECAKVNLSIDQFYNGKVNYGTTKGSMSFQSSRALTGTVSIYVDNVYAGTIKGFATYNLCGFNWGQENLSVPVDAGTHTYRAVDATYNTTWTNNSISVQKNACTQITLR